MNLAEATTMQASGGGSVVVPIGSLEQHGAHLPLHTDTLIAEAIAHQAVSDVAGAWLAPAINYGSSGEHQSFPGTISVGNDVLRQTVVELARSLQNWADRVVFVNGHGGNWVPLGQAVRQLRQEGHDVTWVPALTGEGDLHAGHTETSVMLHLHPELVRLELAEAGDPRPLGEILDLMRSAGVAAVSANGVLGDPTGATADHGRRLVEAAVARVTSCAQASRAA